MGRAKIIAGGDATIGKYNIEIIKEPGKSVARLKEIAKLIATLTSQITAAEDAVTSAAQALNAALDKLNMAISQMKPGGKPDPVVAIPHWANDGNGTVADCEVATDTQIGNYDLTCTASVVSPPSATFQLRDPYSVLIATVTAGVPYGGTEISFRINIGSIPYSTGDSFDIEITEANIDPNIDLTEAQKECVDAMLGKDKAMRVLNNLLSKYASLEREEYRLTQAMLPDQRSDVWCANKTTTLAVGQEVGTIEINMEPYDILIMPDGAVSGALGLLQHVGVSTPSAVFWNWAVMPGIQRWKPTYRLGTIISIDYDNNTCDIALHGAYSTVGV